MIIQSTGAQQSFWKRNLTMMMGMRIGMFQGVTEVEEAKVTVEVRGKCGICGAPSRVEEGKAQVIWLCEWQCPVKVGQDLSNALYERTHRRYIRCPKCCSGYCWTNQSDYFECTDCHVQFVREGGFVGSDDWEHLLLFDEKIDDIQGSQIHVLVLPEKGNNEFPVEQDWQRRIKAAQNARKRMERMLRSMRKWIGCQEIYFDGSNFTAPEALEVHVQRLLMKYKYTFSLHG